MARRDDSHVRPDQAAKRKDQNYLPGEAADGRSVPPFHHELIHCAVGGPVPPGSPVRSHPLTLQVETLNLGPLHAAPEHQTNRHTQLQRDAFSDPPVFGLDGTNWSIAWSLAHT